MTPVTVTLICSLAILLFFLAQGLASSPEGRTARDFFLLGKTLKGNAAAASNAAASMSLATVFFFFLSFGETLGIALFVSPVFLAIGAYLFAKLLSRLEDQKFFSNVGPSTVLEYIYVRTQSLFFARCVAFCLWLGIFSVLLIELFIGVELFAFFHAMDAPIEARDRGLRLFQSKDLALLVIMIVAFFYTAFGGLRAVVRTDRVQFALMLVSMVSFLSWIAFGEATGVFQEFSFSMLAPSEDYQWYTLWLPWPMLVNIIIVNTLFTVAMLRSWLIAAAQPAFPEARKGVIGGLKLTVLVAVLLMFVAILLFRQVFPDAGPGVIELLNQLSNDAGEAAAGQERLVWGIGAYVLLPLFFCACLAALLSTVDSALLPTIQLIYRSPIISEDGSLSQTGRLGSSRVKFVPIIAMIILVFALIAYFLIFRILEYDFRNWLFTIFGFAITAAPALIACVIFPKIIIQRNGFVWTGVVSTVGGIVILTTISLVGNSFGNLALVQLGSPIAVAFSATVVLIYGILMKVRGYFGSEKDPVEQAS